MMRNSRLPILVALMILVGWLPHHMIAQLPDDAVRAMEWNGDGSLLALSRQNGSVEIIDGVTLSVIRTIQAENSGPVIELAWHPDVQTPHLATGGADGVVRIWNAITGNLVSSLDGFIPNELVTGISWNSTNQVVGFSESGRVIFWNTTNSTAIFEQMNFLPSSPTGALSHDNLYYAIVSGGSIAIQNANSPNQGDVIRVIYETNLIIDIAWSPNPTTPSRLASSGLDGQVRLWEASDGSLVRDWPTGSGQLLMVKFSPDGSRVATINGTGEIWIWNANQTNPIQQIATGGVSVFAWKSNDTLTYVDSSGELRLLEIPQTSSHNADSNILSAGNTIVAQDEALDIITDIPSTDVALFEWSPDSTLFTFINTTIPNEHFIPILTHPAWQAFDINTQTLQSPSVIWTLQPDLGLEDFTGALPDQFIYASQDSTLFLYHQAGDYLNLPTVQNAANIAIANALTGESLSLDIPSRIPFSPQSDADVYWAETNQAIAFSTTSAGADVVSALEIYHVTISSVAPLNAVVHALNAQVEGVSYTTRNNADRLLDISPDGEQVLVIATPESSVAQPSQLLIWRPHAPQSSTAITVFDAEAICQATFTPDSLDRIIVTLSNGRMAAYHTATESVQYLAERNSNGCFQDLFSPDGRWLATTRNPTIEFQNIAQRLAQAPDTFLSAPIADAGQDIVLTDPDGDGRALLTLDATNSTDPNGGTLAYVWSLSGPLRNNGDVVELDLSREQVGDGLLFTLTVTNNEGLIDHDSMFVTFESAP